MAALFGHGMACIPCLVIHLAVATIMIPGHHVPIIVITTIMAVVDGVLIMMLIAITI